MPRAVVLVPAEAAALQNHELSWRRKHIEPPSTKESPATGVKGGAEDTTGGNEFR
jgi:hypothetical protein